MLISIYKKALHKFLPRSSAALPSKKEKKKKFCEKIYGHIFKLCLLQEKILCLNSNYTI